MSRFLIVCFMLLIATMARAKSEMKIEGSCRGPLDDGGSISFTYYSSFDGCNNKSKALISFTSGTHSGSLKGARLIEKGEDKYSFRIKKKGVLKIAFWLVFADSTGETEGTYSYLDRAGIFKSVTLQCSIRNYEYSQCMGMDYLLLHKTGNSTTNVVSFL